MKNVLAIILAGGKGARLEPLTRDRAKPAVPFGGAYRIIDFTLSNCLNSGMRKLLLLTQYKAMSLDRHINHGWKRFFCQELDEFVDIVPPQQRIDEQWYQGTADAVYQNIYSVERESPELVMILAGDHIYKMDYSRMVEYHRQNQADLTIAALEVDPESGKQFGIMEIDANDRVVGFEEKPNHPKPVPGNPDKCLASMGIYIFSTKFLFECLLRDANDPNSSHDFGKNIIPSVINNSRVFSFAFEDENKKHQAYWRDVGTLDSYYQANMDLISVDPMLNVYDQAWPIRTNVSVFTPPKFVFGSDSAIDSSQRVGMATDSIVCPGSIVSGGRIERCLLGPSVRINSFALVQDSILFEGVEVGRNASVRRAIVDKNVKIPAGARIGFDVEHDRARGFTISEGGVTVIGKSHFIEPTIAPPKWLRAPAGMKNVKP